MLEGKDWASEATWYFGAFGYSLVEMGQHFHGFYDTSAEVGERA